MKVKYWMTKDPVTITPDAFITEAARVMKERGFRRLPVMDNGKLAGLVTYRNILEAQPSSVRTLSVHEARYLATKVLVKDVMRKNPLTVGPDDDVLTALLEGHKKGLGAYPVLDGEKLVGIVTATDLFTLVVHILGAEAREDFVYLSGEAAEASEAGYLTALAARLAEKNIALLSFLTFPQKDTEGRVAILLKLSPGRGGEAAELLGRAGYRLMA
jgi:acetoin utilization protein AcuB